MLKPELGTKARFNHERIDELVQNPIRADPRAVYAKSLYLNLSTLSPYVSGPNSVKLATPLRDLESQKIAVDKAYLGTYTIPDGVVVDGDDENNLVANPSVLKYRVQTVVHQT